MSRCAACLLILPFHGCTLLLFLCFRCMYTREKGEIEEGTGYDGTSHREKVSVLVQKAGQEPSASTMLFSFFFLESQRSQDVLCACTARLTQQEREAAAAICPLRSTQRRKEKGEDRLGYVAFPSRQAECKRNDSSESQSKERRRQIGGSRVCFDELQACVARLPQGVRKACGTCAHKTALVTVGRVR